MPTMIFLRSLLMRHGKQIRLFSLGIIVGRGAVFLDIGASNAIFSLYASLIANFVYSFDGTNHLCYINGVSYVVNSSNAGVSSQTNLYLGNRVNLDSPMKGNMAITRVYNRGLTASEILQNYNAQKGRFGL